MERYQLRCGIRAIKLERIPLDLLFLCWSITGSLSPRADRCQALARRLVSGHRAQHQYRRPQSRKALGDDPRHPQFVETVIGKGYRFVAPLIPQAKLKEPRPGIRSRQATARNGAGANATRFGCEGSRSRHSGVPVLTCDVIVGRLALGRLPLSELEFPSEVSFPLKPEDRLF